MNDPTNNQTADISVIKGCPTFEDASSFALGVAFAGAALGRSTLVQAPGAMVYHPGINLVIVTENAAGLLTAFQPVLASFRYVQAKRHRALAEMDSEEHQRAIVAVKQERLAFEQSDPMAAAEDIAFFDQQLLELKNVTKPMQMMENQPAGRVTLALGKSADSCLVAVYDSLATEGLLNAARLPRGSLDFEAMTRSSVQQNFDGAFLEGVLDVGIPTPTITSVMMATPEQASKLLLAKDPVVVAFADTCLFVSDDDSTPGAPDLTFPHSKPKDWLSVVSRLLAAREGEPRIFRMSKDAAQALAGFEQQVMEEQVTMPAEQARFTHYLSRQASRVSLILHMRGAAHGDEITSDELKQAADFIKLSARHRMALLQRELQRGQVAFREKVVRIVSAESKPISARDICGHIHGLKPSVLRPTLAELVEAGRLEEQDGKYVGSVNLMMQGSES